MTITSALVRNKVLDPAMESLAHNLDQYNPTREVDSYLERALLALDAGDIDKAKRSVLEAIESNRLEAETCGEVAAFGDRLAADLHRIETRGGQGEFSTKAICRNLRDPLKIILRPEGHTPCEITKAHLKVKVAALEIPADELLKDSVRRDLGQKLTVILERYVSREEA